MNYTWLRMYATCVNADEVPAMPASPVEALRVVDPEASPVWPLDRADVDGAVRTGAMVDARPEVALASEPPDHPTHDPDRVSRCRRLFPASFDERTMTGLLPHHRKRTACP